MHDWDQLCAALTDRAHRVEAQQREKRQRAAARESYCRWAELSVARVIDELFGVLSACLAECTARGAPLAIVPPRDVRLAPTGRCARMVSVRLGPDAVDAYAQWAPGSPPALHLLLSRERRGRPMRMICVPGAWLKADDDKASYRLLAFDRQQRSVALDELARTALRLLALG